MTIKIVGVDNRSLKKYTVTCVNNSCRSILEFNQTDIVYQFTSIMGHMHPKGKGISCPNCGQTIKEKSFKRLT